MTQLNEQQNTQEIISSDGNLPVNPTDMFIQTSMEKVQLDLDDAPFLDDEKSLPAEVAKTEGSVAKTAEGEDEAPKSKKKLFIILGAVLVLLVAAAGVFFFFLMDNSEEIVLQNIIVVPTLQSEEIPASIQLEFDPFWIDLKNNENGAQFLVGKFVISLETQELKTEIEGNLKVVRDAIYYYLVNQNVEFLLDYKNSQEVRKGISKIIDQYMVSGAVLEIYFDSFLMK